MENIDYLGVVFGIVEWNKETFPDWTAGKQEMKAYKEFQEYDKEMVLVGKGDMDAIPRSREELSDVIISYIGLLRYPKVLNAVKTKMKKNIKRTWKDGQHIEENGHDTKH